MGQVHPDAGGRKGLSDADRDDEDLRAVLTVRRLDDEPATFGIVDPASRGPRAAVADGDASRSANSLRFCSISGLDGKYELPSINPGCSARASG